MRTVKQNMDAQLKIMYDNGPIKLGIGGKLLTAQCPTLGKLIIHLDQSLDGTKVFMYPLNNCDLICVEPINALYKNYCAYRDNHNEEK